MLLLTVISLFALSCSTEPEPRAHIAVFPTTMTLKVGTSRPASAIVRDYKGIAPTIVWFSRGGAVALFPVSGTLVTVTGRQVGVDAARATVSSYTVDDGFLTVTVTR